MIKKIEAIDPKIIAYNNTNSVEPYYSIEYYDTADNKWHIGYGSCHYYEVLSYLKKYFIKVEADVAPLFYGHWVYNPNRMDFGLGAWQCSICGIKNDNLPYDKTINPYNYVGSKYCPNCGAKMDGKENNNNENQS